MDHRNAPDPRTAPAPGARPAPRPGARDPRTAPAPGAARPPAGSRPAPFPGAPDAARADIVVEARDVVRVYGSGEARVVALGGVSLSVERGQFVAVME